MKKNLVILILLPLFCNSQNSNCSDFKIGNFIMTSDLFPTIKIKIFRDNEIQTEQVIDLNDDYSDFPKEQIAERIEWIDECHYKLFFKSSSSKYEEFGKFINQSGGILTEIIPINESCYKFKSQMHFDDELIEINGKICKDEYY